jgi:hypothetical protein
VRAAASGFDTKVREAEQRYPQTLQHEMHAVCGGGFVEFMKFAFDHLIFPFQASAIVLATRMRPSFAM